MKKFLILVAAAIVAGAPLASAQSSKLDVAAFQGRIAKSDAAIANAKQAAKASVWLDRGKLFVDAFNAPSANIYVGMDDAAATLILGRPSATAEQAVGEATYVRKTYASVDAFFAQDPTGVERVAFWIPTVNIVDNALGIATEAYQKAYTLDKGSASKVRAGQQAIGDAYKQVAGNDFAQQEYQKAAAAFALAYDVQLAAPAGVVDTLACFNAGFLYTAAQQYDKGQELLEKALAYGYENEGDSFFYLYHCYFFGLKDEAKAKDILAQGMAKYPDNSKIVEGLLAIYTQGDNDPNDIIPVVQQAIDNDPTNAALYSGLGLVYDKLGEPDKAIEAFSKMAELMPDDFGANFNLGLLNIKRGDKLNADFNANSASLVGDDYTAGLAKVNAAYANAMIPLEKALSIREGDATTIELLKNLSFRLRDEPGMMEKYEKYNELFKAL